MTAKVQMGRNGKRDWNMASGNTQVGDGMVGSETNFGVNVKDDTIIREYLKSYQIDSDCEGIGQWFEVTIHTKPGLDDYDKRYYVKPLASAKPSVQWAVVTDRTPHGELSGEGYRY